MNTLINTELSTIKSRLMLFGVIAILIIAFTSCTTYNPIDSVKSVDPVNPVEPVVHFYDCDDGTMVVYGTDTVFVYSDGTIIFN